MKASLLIHLAMLSGLKQIIKQQLLLLILFTVFLIIISASIVGCHAGTENQTSRRPSVNIEATRLKAKEALQYCYQNKFNTGYCILIDMSLHSGIKRFFIWDFKKDTITHSFLVAHGCCDNIWNNDFTKDTPKFSNVEGSHCSSLGKYKIGERAYSSWGVNIKYVLHGLEATNDNAQERFVVLHSWENISDEEVYPNGTPEGWGCPVVSNNSFKVIDPILKTSSKPVLMWIYN